MNQTPDASPLPIEIDALAVKDLIDGSEMIVLIDCRETHEYEYCRIEGAKLIPMNETPRRIAELEEYRRDRIVVYCHAGIRSLHVTTWLRSQGFSNVQSMSGGIDVWSQLVDPYVPRY